MKSLTGQTFDRLNFVHSTTLFVLEISYCLKFLIDQIWPIKKYFIWCSDFPNSQIIFRKKHSLLRLKFCISSQFEKWLFDSFVFLTVCMRLLRSKPTYLKIKSYYLIVFFCFVFQKTKYTIGIWKQNEGSKLRELFEVFKKQLSFFKNNCFRIWNSVWFR